MLSINTQYSFNDTGGAPAFSDTSGSLWDTGVWNDAVWVMNNNYEAWYGVSGLGYYGSLRMKIRGLPGTSFLSAHVLSEIGGVI
jgi:hypothetical protein